MANYNVASESEVLGGPISERVINQYRLRKNILSSRSGRTDNELMFINSQTGWVRLTSGVDVYDEDKQGSSNELAKKYVLTGGQLSDGKLTGGILNDNSGYTRDANLGFRPKPGITGFTVQPRQLYGTLRDSSVEFYVASKDDFDNIEKLFLRPGYNVLLEWGHSLYFTQDENNQPEFNSEFKSYSETFLNSSKLSGAKIESDLNKIKNDSEYNYDGLFGMIKNFSWSFSPDGGYDCSIQIVSHGEILESIKATLYKGGELTSANSEFLTTTQGKNLPFKGNIFQQELKFLNSLTEETKKNQLSEIFRLFHVPFSVRGSEDSLNTDNTNFTRLSGLLILINQHFLLKRKDKDDFITYFDISNKNKFVTFEGHCSGNPFDFIIPPKLTGEQVRTFNRKNKIKIIDFGFIDSEGDNTAINDILINVKYILTKYENFISTESSENSTVFDFLSAILSDLERALGNINEFDIVFDEDTKAHHIVDRRTKPKTGTELQVIDIHGVGSLVENYSFVSKLTPKITTMLAISAQAGNNDAGYEVEKFQKWNVGLEDRHMRERVVDQSTLDNPTTFFGLTEEELEEYTDFVTKVSGDARTRLEILNPTEESNKLKISSEDILNFTPLHTKVTQNRIKSIDKGKDGPPGLIPFELSFTTRGISGIKIGQAFKIQEEFILPERYVGAIAFITTGVTHTVKSNRWVTDIKAQMVVLGKESNQTLPEVEEEEPEVVEEEKTLVYKNPLGNLPLQLREDSQGSGRYNAPRKRGEDGSVSVIHAAWDVLASAGTPVYSPIDGKVEPIPVWTSPLNAPAPLTAIRVIGTGDYTGQQWRLGYTKILDKFNSVFGGTVTKGQQVGNVIEMASFYGFGMKNHLHIDIKRSTDSEFKGKDPSTLTYT